MCQIFPDFAIQKIFKLFFRSEKAFSSAGARRKVRVKLFITPFGGVVRQTLDHPDKFSTKIMF